MSLQLQIDKITASAANVPLKLQLGCGHNILAGWVNTDSAPNPKADYLDIRQQLPFAPNMFAAVFCEHAIEHIQKDEAKRLVAEVFRVLKPGGQFRIVTPSLDKLCKMVIEPQSAATVAYMAFFKKYSKNPEATVTDLMNSSFFWHGHRYLYTTNELVALVHAAGFRTVKAMSGGTYGDPVFQGVDGHGKLVGDDINALETLALEGTKPAA